LLVLDQPSAARLRIRVNGPIDAGTVVEFDRTTRVASVGAENRVTASHQPLRGQSTSQSQP
jgi:hypothetical protein